MALYDIIDIEIETGIKRGTIESWYKWYRKTDYPKPKDCPILPTPIKIKKVRYWTYEEIYKIVEFAKWVNIGAKGQMQSCSRSGKCGRGIPREKRNVNDFS